MNKTIATAGVVCALVAATIAFTSGAVLAGAFAVLAAALTGYAIVSSRAR